ncbi:hypothetical protein BJAS_P3480 [Bathymodiolus japonicus methanotrophic gill symbiont]|nr:hypothetical protein BJAS_P3480 [Bathymodiolus japonicus methanotrophic gill symbiont]
MPGTFSSFFISSISGTDTTSIDMDLYHTTGGALTTPSVYADFPKLFAGDSFINNDEGRYEQNGFVMYNSSSSEVIVEIMIMTKGTFRRPGSGGGGVAKHVSIDGTANVKGNVGITGKPAISIPDPVTVTGKVSIDGDMPSKVKIDGAVALAPDTAVTIKSPVTVTGKVSIDGTLPSKVTVDGAVALAPDTAVTIKTPVTVTGNVATTITGKPTVTIPDVVNVKMSSGSINVDPVPVATNLQPTTVVVGTTIIKLIGARPKRASMSIQSDHGKLRCCENSINYRC